MLANSASLNICIYLRVHHQYRLILVEQQTLQLLTHVAVICICLIILEISHKQPMLPIPQGPRNLNKPRPAKDKPFLNPALAYNLPRQTVFRCSCVRCFCYLYLLLLVATFVNECRFLIIRAAVPIKQRMWYP